MRDVIRHSPAIRAARAYELDSARIRFPTGTINRRVSLAQVPAPHIIAAARGDRGPGGAGGRVC